MNFNSRAPCGARHLPAMQEGLRDTISTHAPHAGRDSPMHNYGPMLPHFNSRAPCGARLASGETSATLWGISTHAPHAGRDVHAKGLWRQDLNFNSRAPCGARQDRNGVPHLWRGFQLTRPMRGATARTVCKTLAFCISTHAPHAGRDWLCHD